MLAIDPDAPLTFEGDIMFYNATLDGAPVRAGITLAAFERLMARAGFLPDSDPVNAMIIDMLAMLQPTIEAYLQVKHFQFGTDEPLVIDTSDLVTH